MKTLEQINSHVKSIHRLLNDKEITDRKANKELEKLKMCRLYIEKATNDAYLKRELADLRDRLVIIDSDGNYKQWRIGNPWHLEKNNYRSIYLKEMGRAKIVNAIKTIKFLLE